MKKEHRQYYFSRKDYGGFDPEFLKEQLSLAIENMSKNAPEGGVSNTMGNFRIIIDAAGGHGVDREPKEGESINLYKEGNSTPDAIAKQFVDVLRTYNPSIQSAKLIHWPDSQNEVTDDLLLSKREKGNF